MRGNNFGKIFSFSSFGESHGNAVGVVIDGIPAGLDFSYDDLAQALKKRAPGHVAGTTSRKEEDKPEILSGIFENKTLGIPIAVIIRNTNQKSSDYNKLKKQNRPGHADLTTMLKYGARDHRGGGRSSGRETIARVIAGYFAQLILPSKLQVKAFTKRLGDFHYTDKVDFPLDADLGPYSFPDQSQNIPIRDYLLQLKKDGDSVGGFVTVLIDHCPAGLGEPAFDKLKADFAKAFLSIGACVSFAMGDENQLPFMKGSEASANQHNFAGIEGGISNGQRITMQIGIKPTSTVGAAAKEGRHDPCIIPRAIYVIEAMAKAVLADHYLRQNAFQLK